MATTPNYSWVMPDPTDFVTDLPADFEIFGDAVDATVETIDDRVTDLEVITTEGDLIVGDASGDPNRLPIGALGTVLTSDGDTAAWAAPASTPNNFTLLNTGGTSLSGTSTTISGISGVDKIMIIIQGARSTSSGSLFSLRLNADTGANYYVYGVSIANPSAYATTFLQNVQNVASSEIIFARTTTNANSVVSGYLLFQGCNASGVKIYNAANAPSPATGNNGLARVQGGYYDSSSTISSITVISSEGSFDAGTIFVYGA